MVWGGTVKHLFIVGFAAEQIVDKGTALRISSSECALAKMLLSTRQGAVGNFNHKVTVVVVVEVAAYAGALRLPVKPGAKLTVVDGLR